MFRPFNVGEACSAYVGAYLKLCHGLVGRLV